MGREPLQELPIEQFSLAIHDYSGVKQSRTNKRPLSPGGTPIVTPVKRRNIAAQGIFPSEKTFKSPPSSLRKCFGSPARFSDVLAGPESPARILDFGPAKQLIGDPQKRSALQQQHGEVTPSRHRPSNSCLATSPDLKPRSSRSTRHYQLPSPNDAFSEFPMDASGSSARHSERPYVIIPRTLPPRSDPHSVHYPGFDVYQDPHTIAYPSESTTNSIFEEENDNYKENKKLVAKPPKTPSSSLYKAALRPDLTKSPKFKPVMASPTSTIATLRKNPNRSSVTPLASQTRKQGRRMLEDELDAEEKDAAFD